MKSVPVWCLGLTLAVSLWAAEKNYDTALELMKAKNYDAAKVLLEAEAQEGPGSPKVCFALGYCLEKLNDKPGAAARYKQAIAANRANAKDPEETGRAMKQLYQIEPDALLLLEAADRLEEMSAKAKERATKDRLHDAAAHMQEEALGAAPKEARPAVPTAPARELTEAEIERNLGYNLGWAPNDAVRGPGGHKYKYYDDKVSWEEAQNRCKKLGGHLATITSAGEYKFIVDKFPHDAWLGGTDRAKEGEWVWITGEPMKFTAWSRGQPDNAGGAENYLHYWVAEKGWNDTVATGGNVASARIGFVCEWTK